MAKKRSGNPKIETRVEREYLARFDVVLKRLQARQAKVLAADLMRVLLLAETRFSITDEERAFLRGELAALGANKITDDPTPVIILSNSGKTLGQNRRRG